MSEIFASPQKLREGEFHVEEPDVQSSSKGFSIKQSAIKRGIISIDPLKSSPGRSRSRYLQDRSARKRAMATKHINLFDDDIEELSEDDFLLIENIIESSKREDTPATPQRDKRLVNLENNSREIDLEINKDLNLVDDEKFSLTPVPSPIQEKKIIEKFGRSHKLLQAGGTLYIDGPEGFFEQHKYKGKVSGNTMAQAPEVTYDQFSDLFKLSEYLYYNEKLSLRNSYKAHFTQFYFELQQGLSLAFYGVGSKRSFLLEFVDNFIMEIVDAPTVVVNGYNPATNAKEIFEQMVLAVFGDKKKSRRKYPANPYESLPIFLKHLNALRSESPKLVLLVHNLDSESLRHEKLQNFFAQIASSRHIWVIASLDHINAPIIWDSMKLISFNFAWHDLTTFEAYLVENGFKDMLSVGQSSKSLGAKGTSYVLNSLTQNARNLYRVLVTQQLQNIEEELDAKSDRSKAIGSVKNGIELKVLYNQCVEEFIASNEISFRTMLREFVEHEMAGLVRNSFGTEIVFVPLALDELEQLLTEELID